MEDGSARGSAVSSVWSWPVTLSVHTGRLLELSLSEGVLQCKDWLFILPSLRRSQRLHLVAKEQTDHMEGKPHWLETMSCLPRRSIACDSQCMGPTPARKASGDV